MEKSYRWELQENVVSTDYVEIAKEGFSFKNGNKFILHYYTYSTPWTDSENIKRFKKLETLKKFYKKLGRGDIENDYCLELY